MTVRKEMGKTLLHLAVFASIIFAAYGLAYWRGYRACKADQANATATIAQLEQQLADEKVRRMEVASQQFERASAMSDKMILNMWGKSPEERTRILKIVKERVALREMERKSGL